VDTEAERTLKSRRTKARDPKNLAVLLYHLDRDEKKAQEKYLDLKVRIEAYFIHHHGSDAHTLFDEVCDVIGKKLLTDEIEKVEAYAFKVAEYVLRDDQRKESRIEWADGAPGGLDLIAVGDDPTDRYVEELDRKAQLQCLRECIRELSNRDRNAFLSYFDFEPDLRNAKRQSLLSKSGPQSGALRTAMCRLRQRMMVCTQDRFEMKRIIRQKKAARPA